MARTAVDVTDREERESSSESENPMLCLCCGHDGLEVFHTVRDVPVNNSLLLDSAEEALTLPVGDLELGCCVRCGFIQNTAYDASLVDYGDGYEDTQAHSEHFVEFATEVSRGLIENHGLENARTLEIGCGKGDFLRLLCGLTGGSGVGYDPALGPGALETTTDRLDFHAEPYTESTREAADLVVCRHTLEHIPNVAGFIQMLRRSLLEQNPLVFFEVPDTLRILQEGAFWDLYYEHCSYFTGRTLQWLFASQGFDVLDQTLGFDDQYLLVEARPSSGTVDSILIEEHAKLIAGEARAYADRVEKMRDARKSRIMSWRLEDRTRVIWGAGSKAVGYLAATGVAASISAVVDINPRKRGRFLPGSALRVVSPDDLMDVDPDVVIAMNPVYVSEITNDLRSRGLNAEVVAV